MRVVLVVVDSPVLGEHLSLQQGVEELLVEQPDTLTNLIQSTGV